MPTLKDLIEILETLPEGLTVTNVSDDVMSYRGYYAHLAIAPGATSVGALLEALRKARGATFEGYKGGDFLMGDATPVWVSGYGECSGLRVTSIGFSSKDHVYVGTEEVGG